MKGFDFIINTLLDFLPEKKLICNMCHHHFYIRRGRIRESQKNYDGPFCPRCGNQKGGKNEKSYKFVFSN
ncbi:hypothetical protein AM501_09790 [Aneurinibacillus migulanus]|nr:hypothetical protein TS64_09205 [Aneurinibacillus migulanus]KPD08444.1 hypothetical protein AM501_09790 [Aneurinibacillus migulanus]